MKRFIDFYNEQQSNFQKAKQKNPKINVDDIISTDDRRIKWTVNLKNDAVRGTEHSFQKDELVKSVYRPFTKQWLYYHKPFIERPGLFSKFFPSLKLKIES
jgi:predicted helicase